MCVLAIFISSLVTCLFKNPSPVFYWIVCLPVTEYDGCFLTPKCDLPNAFAAGGSVVLGSGTLSVAHFSDLADVRFNVTSLGPVPLSLALLLLSPLRLLSP